MYGKVDLGAWKRFWNLRKKTVSLLLLPVVSNYTMIFINILDGPVGRPLFGGHFGGHVIFLVEYTLFYWYIVFL